MKLRASIVGASGYAGGDLVRWLSGHPRVQIAGLYGSAERDFHGLFPNLRQVVTGQIKAVEELSLEAEVVFLALPHGQSAPLADRLLQAGVKVIDLSGDLRLKCDAVHREHYGEDAFPHLRGQAVYGLTELNRERLAGASLVANPGCYPTASILALHPLARAGLIDGAAIVDAKSGVSGAGRSPSATTHYCQVNENVKPYNLGVHRHQPEIEQGLRGTPVFFSPHLVPMTRGILATCYARLKHPTDLLQLYRDAYANEPFVRLLPGDELPQTRATYGSNFVDLAVRYDDRRNLAVVVTALDNLVKGAAGQAVQNLNLMFGLTETEGLLAPAIFV
ncbi:MAG: N-acetyl-gamma-glutamyl-phosphate reductase [Candidatus Eremiobacterota bacterium]